jgi:hypothetical protein
MDKAADAVNWSSRMLTMKINWKGLDEIALGLLWMGGHVRVQAEAAPSQTERSAADLAEPAVPTQQSYEKSKPGRKAALEVQAG